jgi:hypothetical protein
MSRSPKRRPKIRQWVALLVWLVCFIALLLATGGVSLLVYVFLALTLLVIALLARKKLWEKRNLARGWRLEFGHGSSFRYGEFHQVEWREVGFGYRRLSGKGPRILIFIAPPQDWAQQPQEAWAKDRREEILARVKSELKPPRYAYSDDGITSW